MLETSHLLGERSEYRKKESRLRTEVEALRDRLRVQLPPHVEAHELDGEAIIDTAAALGVSLSELKGVRKKLDVLNRKLGE